MSLSLQACSELAAANANEEVCICAGFDHTACDLVVKGDWKCQVPSGGTRCNNVAGGTLGADPRVSTNPNQCCVESRAFVSF